MERPIHVALLAFCLCAFLSQLAQARPQQHELQPVQAYVDVVGDVDGTSPPRTKTAQDTLWIATWDFEGCDETGWTRSDNRILNDGSIYWSVNTNFAGVANIVGEAASVGTHNLCWIIPDGYDNNWYQGIRIHYIGDSFLSFDYLVDAEAPADVLQIETDPGCSSFSRVDYDVWPDGNAQAFRDLVWSVTGFDTVTARVDSIPLSGYATADTHCVYIAFFSDSGYNPTGKLYLSLLGVGAVVDNVLLEGAMPTIEDFSSFTQTAWLSFVNMRDITPFGTWARTHGDITDNDMCTDAQGCAWFSTDDTTPTFANHASMAFAPGGYVVKNWLDEIVIGPWVSITSTNASSATIVQFRRFPGNWFGTSKIVQNWSVRGRTKIANTNTPAPGDSIACISSWGHSTKWNSLSLFSWVTSSWDMSADFSRSSQDIQLRFRLSDWQWIAGSGPAHPFRPGPGPFWDRVRIGRIPLTGPVIAEGIDARYQAQDAAPNDPSVESGPLYSQATGANEIFGTVAFSSSADLGANVSTNLIVGDSITVDVEDILGNGGLTVELHAAIIDGPHVGKSPPPFIVGANGFFVLPADSSRTSNGSIVANRYFVDMDDTYFRGGDVVRYFWWATDQLGGATSNPSGLTTVPTSIASAEAATNGLFEVNFLPTINWDPTYLGRIASDTNGDLDPTPGELANSSQANCILYYQNINWRRRSGDVNRTSFMYTLDKLGYQGKYDIYDHMGLGNTNNALGARMSPSQAKNYALLIYDAGDLGPGAPILPTGMDLDNEKIDMSTWFQTWNGLSGSPNAEHTLWILGSNVMQEKPSDPLFTSMAASFNAANQGQGLNPNIFGVADFSNHNTCLQPHAADRFVLNGGCPSIRGYDDIRPTGTGVQTHVYGDGAPSSAGAIVMHANAAGYTTIMQSFPWFDISTSNGQVSTTADEDLLTAILSCALPAGCQELPIPTNVGDDGIDPITVPSRFALHQNAPNPFNPTTTFTFDLAQEAHVSLNIYDVAGRLVRDLVSGRMTPGFRKQVPWNGQDNSGTQVSTGVYLYRLTAGDFVATRKLIVMK